MSLQSLLFISEASLEGKLFVPQQYYFHSGILVLFCFPHCLIWLTPGLRYLVQRNFDTINHVLSAWKQAKEKASIITSQKNSADAEFYYLLCNIPLIFQVHYKCIGIEVVHIDIYPAEVSHFKMPLHYKPLKLLLLGSPGDRQRDRHLFSNH